MRIPSKPRRAALGAGALLAMSIGHSGCYGAEGGLPEAFCGYLYYCGSHSDPNQGGGQTATGSSSNSSSSNSTSTGQSTPEPDPE